MNEPTDDDLRAMWRNAGGRFYGPNVETGAMPERELLAFLRAFAAGQTSGAGSGAELVREIEAYCDKAADKRLEDATLGEQHARALVVAAVWWHGIRAALIDGDAAREDSARLEWVERLFEMRWTGTLGESSQWRLIGPYRHVVQTMRGETFREAIDRARGGKSNV